MPGKETILRKVKQNKPATISLPETQITVQRNKEGDLLESFKACLQIAGAAIFEYQNVDELNGSISKNYTGTIDFGKIEDWEKFRKVTSKNELEKIGVVIMDGRFGVAENGALWMDEGCFPNRLIPFIAEKLIIRLKKKELVADMHEAYQKLKLNESGFGVFISGPSKTADIEQSLVYGAHGAKELLVMLY